MVGTPSIEKSVLPYGTVIVYSYLFDAKLGDNVAPVSLTYFKEASLDFGLITLIV